MQTENVGTWKILAWEVACVCMGGVVKGGGGCMSIEHFRS